MSAIPDRAVMAGNPSNAQAKAWFLEQFDWLASAISSSRIAQKNILVNPLLTINQNTYASGGAIFADQFAVDGWLTSTNVPVTWVDAGGVRTITIPAGQTLRQLVRSEIIFSGNYTLSWEGSSQGRIFGASAFADSPITTPLANGVGVFAVEFGPGTLRLPQLESGSKATSFACLGPELEKMRAQDRYRVKTVNVVGQSINYGLSLFCLNLDPPMFASSFENTGAVTILDNGFLLDPDGNVTDVEEVEVLTATAQSVVFRVTSAAVYVAGQAVTWRNLKFSIS